MILFLALVRYAFRIYEILLLIRILISWIPVSYNKFLEILYKLTDPYLDLFKKIIPPFGMIDFSPIVAFLVLGIVEQAVYRLLFLFY